MMSALVARRDLDVRLGALARFAPVVELALVALIAWEAAGFVTTAPEPARPDANAGADRDVEVPVPPLSQWADVPLFGEPERRVAKPKARPAPPKPAAPSRLDAKLLGTIVAGPHSAAILKLAREREQHVYFLGDTIEPGIRLVEVHHDAAIVERGGRRERIELEPLPEGGLAAAPAAGPPRPARPPAGARTMRMPRTMIERQLRDFPKLLSQARVVPHFADGKADGFVITDIVPGSLYEQAGLRNGDIIVRVNGQRVTSAQQAMAMYQALEKASSIDLEVLRGGQMQRLHYDIR